MLVGPRDGVDLWGLVGQQVEHGDLRRVAERRGHETTGTVPGDQERSRWHQSACAALDDWQVAMSCTDALVEHIGLWQSVDDMESNVVGLTEDTTS